MKKIFVILFLFAINLFAQDDYIRVDNPVYNFLERMEALHITSGYNSFEIPKPRRDIVQYLKQVIEKKDKLNNTDGKILKDLEVEFEHELFGTLNNSQSLLGEGSYDPFSQKAKYIYYFDKPGKANLFINLLGEGDFIAQNIYSTAQNASTTLGIAGGQIEGTFLDHFGFSLRGTNGNVFGNREVAKLRPDIAENFKYSLDPAAAFFDQTEGYLTADYDMLRIKLGRDKIRIGFGPMKSILDDYAPAFDYLGLNIHYDIFEFSYFQAKLLGNLTFQPDSITGGINTVDEKYLGYHRIGFNLSNDFNFGIGEMIIYGGRPIDLSYLNPFVFYKSIEHANQDRDNSFLFFDFNNKTIAGLKIYGTLLIDDIDFGKLGTGWYGNQTLLDVGIYSANLYKLLPLDIRLEYTKIDPYVHTHRTGNSNFTNDGINLGSTLKPNSQLFLAGISYQINYRLNFTASFSFIMHGANPVLPDGKIINVGGDESLGHRMSDSNITYFLNGDLEYSRVYTAYINYEPFKQIKFNLKLIYLNESLQNLQINRQLQSYFTLSAVL